MHLGYLRSASSWVLEPQLRYHARRFRLTKISTERIGSKLIHIYLSPWFKLNQKNVCKKVIGARFPSYSSRARIAEFQAKSGEQGLVQIQSQKPKSFQLCGLKAKPLGLETITSRLKAITSRLEAIASRSEAIASRSEAVASRSEALASRLEAIRLLKCWQD